MQSYAPPASTCLTNRVSLQTIRHFRSLVAFEGFPLIGRNGHQLDEGFAANPYGYMAIGMNNFPNCEHSVIARLAWIYYLYEQIGW